MLKPEILFDASPMVDSRKTGVGYYVDHLIKSIGHEFGARIKLTGYYFDFLGLNHKNPVKINGVSFKKIRFVPGKLLSLCRKLGFQPYLELFIFKKHGTTIFTNYVSLPSLRKNNSSVIIYDLSFLDCPEYIQDSNLRFLKKFCPPSIQNSKFIITISEFTKSRIQHHYPNLSAPILVTPIPPRDDHKSIKRSLPKSMESLGIKKDSYILFVGTLEPRKNIDTLVDAYVSLNENIQNNQSLVLAGGEGWKIDETLKRIDDLKSRGFKIITTGYVTDEELESLYSNATIFVLPSHYEGFGMPILEAMQYKLPVILSDIPVFREVAGDSALYFDKDSSKELASCINSVFTDSIIKDGIVNNSKVLLKKYSWQENAKIVYKELEKGLS